MPDMTTGSALESLRLIAMSVKLTGTTSMNARDQEMLRDSPFTMAVRLVGAGGGPEKRLLCS